MNYKDANRIALIMAGILLALGGTAFGINVIYVDGGSTGAGDGSSWSDAYNYLQDALSEANFGAKPVEIRVAGGVYRPDESAADPNGSGDRDATFQLISGVILQGGYAGFGEGVPDLRDVAAYESVLSGDLDSNDVELADWEWDSIYDYAARGSRDENSRTVVTGSGTDSSAVLDGFTITGGQADCSPVLGGPGNNGGGMYNESGSPTVVNCIFKRNVCVALFWNDCEQPSHTLTECGRLPDASGGAVYNANSNPTLVDCNIVENIVFSGDVTCAGGGMFNINSDPVLTRCELTGNVVTGFDDEYYGGGMYNHASSPTLTDCSFIGNASIYSSGGGMVNTCRSNPTLNGCNFEGNISGGMSIGDDATVIDCTFIGNEGGAVGIGSYSRATFRGCVFSGNSGGGISISGNARPTVTDCTFVGNSSDRGGGIYSYFGSSPEVVGCWFFGNTAAAGGGAVSVHYADARLINCIFSGNEAGGTSDWHGGGAVHVDEGTAALTNCTFGGNSGSHGNAVLCRSNGAEGASSVDVGNCIFRDGGDEIGSDIHSTVSISYSDVEGGWPGVGNIDADPCFADADGVDDVVGTEDDDLAPVAGSPCIDAGGNSLFPVSIETDVVGRVRIMNERIDMGAHEIQAHIYVDGANGDDLNDGLTPQSAVKTIPHGIDLAGDTGYTVLVYPGVYNESINFYRKAVTVKGIGDAPILDVNDDYGIKAFSGEGPDSVVKNFVVRGCYVGIFTADASPTIKNITVVDNDFGATAYTDVKPDISNCIFWGNRDGDLYGCSTRYSWVEEEIARQPVEDLICHWKLDEGGGDRAYDSVGGNHLELWYPEWVDGQMGGGLEFGNNDCARVEDDLSQQISSNQITLSVWIKLKEDVGEQEVSIISKGLDDENSWSLGVYGEGHSGSMGNQVVFHDSDGVSQSHDCVSSRDLSVGQWHHICVTDIGGRIRMYIDGELDRSCEDGYGIPSSIGGPVKVGCGHYQGFFRGSIDDARIYGRALGAEEAADLHDNGLWDYGSLADPLFADPANNDYHLRSQRGRYWPEYDLWVLDAVNSPCIDAGDPNDGVLGEITPNGGRTNMGAYGGTAYASMSECWSSVDYNCDGVVDMKDFANVADKRLQAAEWIE